MADMRDEARRRAEELFQQVVDLAPEERRKLLDRHSQDPVVRAEVEALLAHDAASGGSGTASFPDTMPVFGNVLRLVDSLAKGPLLEEAQRLGDYRIVRPIGRGGMGTVYEAIQESLGRKVALKVLPDAAALDPELVERFRREVRATARIRHPSIVPIHEVGEVGNIRYYAMELIDGPSLETAIVEARRHAGEARRDSPPSSAGYIKAVVEEMAALCEGLEEAHAQGLIHRDIKPANILVARSGRYVLADFGLVRDTRAETLTRSGQMLGTLSYMSPEQVAGEDAGATTDVYSLGVTLFELLTLERPFAGRSAHEIQSAILHEEPPAPRRRNPRLDRDLETIILHCLEKEPAKRYATAGALAADLRRFLRSEPIVARPQPVWEKASRRMWRHRGRVAVALVFLGLLSWVALDRLSRQVASVAVLPFVNESAAPEVDYLSDGLTDSLIFRLGQLGGLRVKSRSAVARFRGKDVEPQAAGEALEVDAVLTGRVLRRGGDDILVAVELVGTRTSETLWGERYERRAESLDLQGLEEEISAAIVEKLRVKLTDEGEKQLAKRYTPDPGAYLAYWRGRHVFLRYTEEDIRKSIEYFQQAIDTDPKFALAHVGMAEAHIALGNDFEPPKDVFPVALAHALEAEKLDPMLGEAHAVLGTIRLYYNWDWEAARRELKRALELNPRCAESFPCYLHSLDALGRPEEARRQVEETLVSVDPGSLTIQAELGCTEYYGGRYEEAIAASAGTLKVEETHVPALYNLARAYGQTGRFEEAIRVLEKARLASGDASFVLAELGYVHARAGNRARAEEILATLMERRQGGGFVDPYYIAFVHVALGDDDRALDLLREAFDVKSSWVPWLKVEPKFFGLHRDPRFQELLKGLGFPAT
jgi:serine/threonine protein kinase/tetratricopeptide (TPR) repeat protein